MMTRKDYVETARLLNKYKSETSSDVFADLVDDFSYMFEKDNPRFNSQKFLEACNNDTKQNNYFTSSVNVMGSNYLHDRT